MNNRGSLDDFYAYKSTTGNGSHSGASGCSMGFYILLGIILLVNFIAKIF